MKSKIISVLLILSAVLGAAGEAVAKDPPPIGSTYEYGGLTYYNANSQNFNSDKRFFVDLISAKHSSLGGHSIADLWLMTGVGLALQLGYWSDILTAVAKEGILNGSIGDDKRYIYSYSYEAPEWQSGGYVSTKATAKYNFGDSLGIEVYFDNFSVGALLPADEGLYVQTVVDNGSVKSITASSVKNDTADMAQPTQEITRTTAETLTSTVSHSSLYSFTEGLKLSAATELFGSYKMSVELSAQFTQAFSDGWSKSASKTTSLSTKSGVIVILPPYTNVLIKQGDADTIVTTKYNCPVFLSYRVRIRLLSGPYITITREYNFGTESSNAMKDLNHRAFEEGSKQYDREKIDWVKALSDSDVTDAIRKITAHVPMSGTGATMNYTNKTTYTEVAGKTAIYPLDSVQLGKSNIPFIDTNKVANMKVGNYSYVDYLTVSGLNARKGAYYGFDPSAGSWVIVDDNGEEFASGDAPVVLEKEKVSGHTKFRAVKAGTCNLKYLINENKYPTSYGAKSYTKNEDLTSTAVLRIEVAEEEVTYEVNGSYKGVVNTSADSIEGDGKLEVSVYDSTGKEIEGTYLWDKREIRGITLTPEGMVSFTRPGKYHVRVTSGTGKIYSDWAEISAEALAGDYVDRDEVITREGIADEDTTFIITGSYVGGLSTDENIEGDGKLHVEVYDSTGREELYEYSWEKRDDADGMTIDEAGNVSFTKTGSYYVRVRSGNVYSDWAEITVNVKAPARFTSVPSAKQNIYDGTAKVLVNEDGAYEGGKIILYALGEDEVTEPVSYSSELPTATGAGTYYVWSKVIGDTTHDDSEAVCVTATITGASDLEPEPEPYYDNPGVGGASSGCNGVFSVFCFCLMISAPAVIRKAQ